jgi:hypothetical protein
VRLAAHARSFADCTRDAPDPRTGQGRRQRGRDPNSRRPGRSASRNANTSRDPHPPRPSTQRGGSDERSHAPPHVPVSAPAAAAVHVPAPSQAPPMTSRAAHASRHARSTPRFDNPCSSDADSKASAGLRTVRTTTRARALRHRSVRPVPNRGEIFQGPGVRRLRFDCVLPRCPPLALPSSGSRPWLRDPEEVVEVGAADPVAAVLAEA